jgi:SAM-dependent methyltransferase
MPPTAQDDKKPLGFELDGFDWDQYLCHRPNYPPSFYEKIYAHHASLDGNVFDVAHDVGAGPGIVAEQLASQFKKVIVSERNASYLDVAKHRLSSISYSTFEFLSEKAEESRVADGTVDLIVISMVIHWTDVDATIRDCARQLKSGGTLYIVNYAFCNVIDDPKANNIMREIVMDYVDTFQSKPEQTKAILHQAFRTLSCGFDNLGFDKDIWKGVRRVIVNGEGDNKILEAPARFKVDSGPIKVGENEERVFVEGDESWVMEGRDVAWFKQAFAAFEFGGRVEDSMEKWSDFEEAVGGKDKKMNVVWPSVHTFATKK